jgi:uncharacterized protein (TIGR03437 family)
MQTRISRSRVWLALCSAVMASLADTGRSQVPAEPRLIGPDTGWVSRPHVAVHDAKVFVAYAHAPAPRGQPDVFVTASEDGGRTFSSPFKLTEGPAGHYHPTLAVGSAGGVLYVAWSELDPGATSAAIRFTRTLDPAEGKGFRPAVTISGAGLAFKPRIALDEAENIYVVWESGGNSVSQRVIEFSRSADGGKTFSTPRRLSRTGEFGDPNILWLGGELHVVWRALTESRGAVFYSASKDRGETFSAPVAVPGSDATTAPLEDFIPLFGLGPGRDFGLLFTDVGVPGGALYFVRFDPETQSFQSPVRLTGARGMGASFGGPVRPDSAAPRTVALGWLGRGTGAESAGEGLFLACSADLARWPEGRRVLDLAEPARELRASVDATGQLHLVFTQYVAEVSRLNYFQARCPPRFAATTLVNAASQQAVGLVPGALATIYGTDLGPAIGEAGRFDEKTGLIATNIAGVEVMFDQARAPLLFARHDQINLQVPIEVAARQVSRVTVLVNGVSSEAAELPVARAGPAFFTLDGSGRGPVVAQNQDNSLNTSEAPARRGAVVTLYATGQGQVAPPVRTGQVGPLREPFPQPVDQVTILIDEKSAEVLWAGLAPGLLGVLQVNARVPENVASGRVSIRIRVGGALSPDGTTLYTE